MGSDAATAIPEPSAVTATVMIASIETAAIDREIRRVERGLASALALKRAIVDHP
jgi:hypothetical protein